MKNRFLLSALFILLSSSVQAITFTGCSVTATAGGVSSEGYVAGTYTSGTTGACSVVIALPLATTAWSCFAQDTTTVADVLTQTAKGQQTVTIAGVTVSGDVIQFGCLHY